MAQFKSRRIGRFHLDCSLARENSTVSKRVMGKCIILRAEAMLPADVIEYVAVSDHFRELEEGSMIPLYMWTIDGDEHITCHEVKE